MPVVHVPSSLRALTDGRTTFDVPGATLGQVFAAVGRECPALVARVIEDGAVREDMAIAIDGSILEGGELVQAVPPNAEIYLVPPIGGGAPSVTRVVALPAAPLRLPDHPITPPRGVTLWSRRSG